MKIQEEEKKKQREMMKLKWERERERQKEEKAREQELIQRQKEEKERERERLKEGKAREHALNQKRKEEEAKRKEAEMLERKRRREEDEKKGKDRKRVCKEQQRKVHAEKEEKELKYRAADEKASKKKGFQDEEMKDPNPEKVKGREECAKGRQTQTKKASGVNEHSVDLKESHSNENAVSCVGQVNEVVASATDGTLEQSYDISPYISSDGEEDDDLPDRKVIPSWSRQYCQVPLSCSQQPKTIFSLSSFCNINQVLRASPMETWCESYV